MFAHIWSLYKWHGRFAQSKDTVKSFVHRVVGDLFQGGLKHQIWKRRQYVESKGLELLSCGLSLLSCTTDETKAAV